MVPRALLDIYMMQNARWSEGRDGGMLGREAARRTDGGKGDRSLVGSKARSGTSRMDWASLAPRRGHRTPSSPSLWTGGESSLGDFRITQSSVAASSPGDRGQRLLEMDGRLQGPV